MTSQITSLDSQFLDLSKWAFFSGDSQLPLTQQLRAVFEILQKQNPDSSNLPALPLLDLAHCGYPILIQPGWQDSGPEHWQTKWQKKFDLTRIQQRDWENPTCEEWTATIAREVNARPSSIVVAHSLGCIATVHAIQRGLIKPAAVVLVAPADMDNNIHNVTATGFTPIPTTKLGCPSLVIASTNDKYMTGERSRELAKCWGSDFVLLSEHGHINAQSNLGEWEEGQRMLSKLILKLTFEPHEA